MKKIYIIFFCVLFYGTSFAYINPDAKKTNKKTNTINTREDCVFGTKQSIQNINNVRATLLTSGDSWWDLSNGQYFVPNTPPEIQDISSIFAGSVWVGGYEPIESGDDILKIAITQYRTQGGDWYPGPLNDDTGTTEKEVCNNWDRHFQVLGREIDLHRANLVKFTFQGLEYPKDSMPDNVRFWPGVGNTDFALEYGFQLPDAGQGLASFFDHPDSQIDVYDPENGDFPKIDVRGCESLSEYPDEMFFWIYNDAGGDHTGTNGSPIQMEVQVQAFAYESNDELNDMTFQRYKLINRAQTVIKDCYFAMWVDADLGCSEDDAIGCDTSRSLAIIYNLDEVDGDNGCDCSTGAATYCTDVPILGIDYFRGPLKPQIFGPNGELMDLVNLDDEVDTFVEIGMSSFIYTHREGQFPSGTLDCQNAAECYNLLQGKWRDGLAVTFGGLGYTIGSTDSVKYTFPGAPNDGSGWSMCSANLGPADRRTIQASGPFILKQGAINELIIGVVWVPDQLYPCPELSNLNKADDLAQALFDNCFQTLDGPDGPDVDVIELDRQIVLLLSNDTILSNNKFEEYSEVDIFATDSIAKSLPDDDISYKFEGYLIYQLRTPNSNSNLNDIDNVRLVQQVDLRNGVTTLYNWNSQVNPLPGNNELVFTPEKRVTGIDNSIAHSFSITSDAFNQGDTRLINHREYYFFVIAYGYNEYAPFDPKVPSGQQRPYISGRRSFGVVTVVPRPMVYDELNAFFGESPKVTRLQGVGNQGQFILLEDDMYDKILNGDVSGGIEYKENAGPLKVKIVNPLDVKDGDFKLEVNGTFDKDGKLEANNLSNWIFTDLNSGKTFTSYKDLETLNERILREYGISLTISREPDVSNTPLVTPGGTFVGSSIDYNEPLGSNWLRFVPSGAAGPFLNFIDQEQRAIFDPTGAFSNTGGLNMIPLKLASLAVNTITPGLRNSATVAATANSRMQMGDLNNVDIVFTSDRTKWSKCIVVETSHTDFYRTTYLPEGQAKQLEIRDVSSVSRDDIDGNGNPAPLNDGTTGFGWFPGYAVDVESGERLNIFFGENSTYGGIHADKVGNIGRDMTFNPNSLTFVQDTVNYIWNFVLGGQHTIYVTRTEYDGCASFVDYFKPGASTGRRVAGLGYITWTGIPILPEGEQLKSYADGLIPNDVVVKLRVDNTFGEELDFIDNKFEVREGANPIYNISIKGKEAVAVTAATIDEALSNVNVVPNPYYAASVYEVAQNDSRVKITNVPSKSTITIYSLDGRFITQFKRDARREAISRSTAGVNFRQEGASIIWDLKNSAGIPVSSGVYLFHIVDEETGAQKTVKWFGINRKFDPSGL